MATIRDVARVAGVSVASVSRVINQSGRVSPAVEEKVSTAIRQLNYEPSDVARSLAIASTRTLACIVPDISNPFFPELVRGVEDVGRGAGYAVILCNSDDDIAKEDAYLRLLVRRRVDGLVLIPGRDEAVPRAVLGLMARGAPVVTVDRRLPTFPGDSVTVDNVAGGVLAARHLLDLGHRRIAVVNRHPDTSSARDRQEGYERELRAAGCLDPRLLRLGEYTIESGRALTTELLRQDPPPTALLAGNDLIALAAVQAASDLGLRVPADLSVVGFDGIGLADLVTPRLTTVAQPIYEMGRLAADVVVQRRSGVSPDGVRRHQLEATLRIGGTTAPPPAAT